MHIYGEKLAVVTSALMFGLFHGNLSQFFYAFALGLVFGYVYLKTGKLRYSIGLHMLINSLGSVKEVVGFCYWGVLTAIYLAVSFLNNRWDLSWIIFAVGGVLFPVVMCICNYIADKDKKD